MDKETAKAILSRYRPGQTDSLDKNQAEAMELAHRDPELREWFRTHCARHSQKDAPLPVEPSPARPDSVAGTLLPWGRVARWTIVVAFLLLIAPFLWSSFAPQTPNTFSSYRDRMARLVQRTYPMKTATTNQDEIRQYLRLNGGVANFDLPHHMETFRGHGAAVFPWHNQPVSLLGLETPETNYLYLFITARSIFVDPPEPAQFRIEVVGKLMTVTWCVESNVYLLTAEDTTSLKNYLQ